MPLVARVRPLRAAGFRRVANLDVTYRPSPAVENSGQVRVPAAGARLPDARAGETTLHSLAAGTGFHLLLAGQVDAIAHHPCVTVHRLDRRDPAWARLRIREAAQVLVRPDGYIAYRSDGTDLAGLRAYLDRWLSG